MGANWQLLTPEYAAQNLGFNVIGFVTGSLGLGEAARNTVKSMDRAGIRMRVVDYPLGDERSGHDHSCDGLGESHQSVDPLAINLFHVNPPEASAVSMWGSVDFVNRFNVCVPFWELTVMPPDWLEFLAGMDVILAPTRFIQDTVQSALPDAFCLPYPQAVALPEGIEPNRAKWGIAEDAVVFVCAFDMASDINRKNPWAAIEAFKTAFPKAGRERLIIKANTSSASRAVCGEDIARLNAVVSSSENVQLVDQVLPFSQVLELYASADVLVSLHRSEGLGLSLMEAMSNGKPVITTGWSGNMDFTNEHNACLVDYTLIPVDSSHAVYNSQRVGAGALWAEPDIEHAASWMRRLASDPSLRASMGQQGARDMESRLTRYRHCEPWYEIMALVEDAGSALWENHDQKINALAR